MTTNSLMLYCLSLQDLLNHIVIETINTRGFVNKGDYKKHLKRYKIDLKDKLDIVNENIEEILEFKSMY